MCAVTAMNKKPIKRCAQSVTKPWLLPIVGIVCALMPMHMYGQDITGIISRPTEDGGQEWSIQLQTLILLSAMAFIPAMLLMMTSFTRIVIVLSLLRTAIGTQSTPPNQVLLGLALFLTFFVMSPMFDEIYTDSWPKLTNNEITFQQFAVEGSRPLKNFMMAQTRETDLAMFAGLAQVDIITEPEQLPLRILMPAFITSELKTAFQIGFTIFIPFLIVDLVVASVLMSLGMMMVPPATISLPFKLMLFVLVDGWQLIIGSLAQSFYI